ncbi:MAG: tetratricopeptide repeat protein, partial [Ensifer adhaerens]
MAARGGHVGAQGRLATIYHEGPGVERNPKEAFRWWYSAAQQRHHGAQMMLAASYELGIVVEADLEEAAYWASLS